MTKSQKQADNLCALFRSRAKLIHIVSREEARVEETVFEAAAAAKYIARCWDVAQGCTDINGIPQDGKGETEKIGEWMPSPTGEDTISPDVMIATIAKRGKETDKTKQERGVWIMRDLPVWLSGSGAGASTMRQLRNFARTADEKSCAQTIVIISPNGDIAPELSDHTTVVNWELPDRDELSDLVDKLIDDYGLQDIVKNGMRDSAIDAAIGLSYEEAQACYNRSLVQNKTIDAAVVSSEKKRVIAREKILEWHDPLPGGLDAVGGLENLKVWLKGRASAFTPKAREYGLPRPKGTFLIGISGCGKSLTCKAIATAWGCPLIRVDLGALKSKYVGESEANLRKAFQIIEALGFCVVWFDEVEKALQGATSGSADGGVSADAMGAVLTWMQERKSDAFVIMTANDVTQLPPEFLRKGRFDEVWWVDLPNAVERVEVLKATLRQHGRGNVKIDVEKVAAKCSGFTGSEIAAIVPDALFASFADNARELSTDDLLAAAETVTPLSVTAKEKIEAMRKWSNGRARFASKSVGVEISATRKVSRSLDVEMN